MGFKLLKGVEVVLDLPGLHLRDKGVLVVTDLHIGYELALQKQGIYIPKSTYTRTKSSLRTMIEEAQAEKLVILGDVKHEFGVPSDQEWIEVKDLLRWLQELGVEVHVVRGNHDNYIISILKRFGAGLHDPSMVVDEYMLAHGHKPLEEVPDDVEVILIGHEHPAIAVKGYFGVKEKFKCFLRGDWMDRKLVVLPAMSPLAGGSSVNEVPREFLLSPILRATDIDSFTPIVIEPGAGVYE
ncbi:MAG: hypothetical protein DRJ68_05110, partial [Thermoprotei archaeon]